MASKPPKIKTDGTANPVTLTVGYKLKIIDELEASAVCNFAEIGRKYKVSRPTISKLWKDRESVKKEWLETGNKERKRKRPFKEEDVERGLKKKWSSTGLMCFKIILNLSYSLSYFMMILDVYMFYSEINIP